MFYGFLCDPKYFRPKCWNYGKLPIEADLRPFLYFLGGQSLYWKMGKMRKMNPSNFYKPSIFYSIFLLLLKIYYRYFQYQCNTSLFKWMGGWAGWCLTSQSITSGYEASTDSFGCHLMTVSGIPTWGSMMMRSHCTVTTTCSLFHFWQDGINPHIWLLICFQDWKWFWTSR